MAKTDDTVNEATWHGDAAVTPKGGMNLPVEVRRGLGLEDGGKVLVFGEPGRVILTPVPLADELLDFASDRGRARFGDGANPEGSTNAS